ncbi:hypothetical protein N7526_003964 [Penicillium atrosanguineum]|nr:hypothetical protein N7526_003964 [Penicillium atrosanguineum]
MAFRAPAQAPRRRTSYSAPQRPPSIEIPESSTEQREEDTAQWVLFSPAAPTHTTSTDRTAGASRLSDFGSFGIATRSAAGPGDELEDEEALDDQFDEDGTELDSLDDGLHAFRAPSFSPVSPARADQGPPAMLPAHDGLGSFQASSQQVQDQLWQHEQYNPQRRPYGYSQHRRHSSVQRHLDTVDEGETNVEKDRWQRIEQWRMDQSRALMQEIERETQRRRSSRGSQSNVPRSIDYISPVNIADSSLEEEAAPEGELEIDESFWQRITRKVIRDLIGIDENLLSIIFGESLPLDAETHEENSEDLNMETVLAREPEPEQGESPLWQSRVLQRIAHELGILVHQLCEHPGAFSTYYQMTKDVSSEYAGMPLNRLAESNILQKSESTAQTSANTTADSMPSPHFMPTLRDTNREHEAQWGIEEDDLPGPDPVSESTRAQQEQEYWEHGLDVMMVFRYLRTRFSRRGYMSNDKLTSNPSPRHTQDPSRRAAIIRQHHPLVARAHSRSQTQSRRASHISGPVGVSSPLVRPYLRRPGSSCASQSKLSAVSSHRTLTGSSRNYWDIGGSVESNSAIGVGVGAGLGVWGEV